MGQTHWHLGYNSGKISDWVLEPNAAEIFSPLGFSPAWYKFQSEFRAWALVLLAAPVVGFYINLVSLARNFWHFWNWGRVSKEIKSFIARRVSQRLNLRHLCETLGGTEGLFDRVGFKKTTNACDDEQA